MRIALVITELDPGGAEGCLTELALHLDKAGHSVGVWSLGPAPPIARDLLVQRLKTAGINVRFGNARGWSHAWPAARWLKRELKTFQPVIVQSMLWHANVITAWAMSAWLTRGNRIPLIGGMRVSEPRSGRWWPERMAAKRMRRVICVSQDVAAHAELQERIPRDKLLVIPNGVSERWLSDDLEPGIWSELIQQSTTPITNETKMLLLVGRLEQQKGVWPLIDHLPAIFKDQPEWQLTLMGDGSLKPQLIDSIEHHGLQERVHLSGWQPSAPKWMKSSELLLLPAEYEGMPNVLLEAMAVGRPFVAFAVDGVRELISSSGPSGSSSSSDAYPSELAEAQLVEPGNWAEFVRLVRQQMHDPDLRVRCGQANRQHVARHFRLGAQLDKYLAVYKKELLYT